MKKNFPQNTPQQTPKEAQEKLLGKEALKAAMQEVLAAAKQMKENSLKSIQNITERILNPDANNKVENPNKLSHSEEILINQIAANDKETLSKLFTIKLTFINALNNLNQKIQQLGELIKAKDARFIPSNGIIDFTGKIKNLAEEKNSLKFSADAHLLGTEMLQQVKLLEEEAKKIDISA